MPESLLLLLHTVDCLVDLNDPDKGILSERHEEKRVDQMVFVMKQETQLQRNSHSTACSDRMMTLISISSLTPVSRVSCRLNEENLRRRQKNLVFCLPDCLPGKPRECLSWTGNHYGKKRQVCQTRHVITARLQAVSTSVLFQSFLQRNSTFTLFNRTFCCES